MVRASSPRSLQIRYAAVRMRPSRRASALRGMWRSSRFRSRGIISFTALNQQCINNGVQIVRPLAPPSNLTRLESSKRSYVSISVWRDHQGQPGAGLGDFFRLAALERICGHLWANALARRPTLGSRQPAGDRSRAAGEYRSEPRDHELPAGAKSGLD